MKEFYPSDIEYQRLEDDIMGGSDDNRPWWTISEDDPGYYQ